MNVESKNDSVKPIAKPTPVPGADGLKPTFAVKTDEHTVVGKVSEKPLNPATQEKKI